MRDAFLPFLVFIVVFIVGSTIFHAMSTDISVTVSKWDLIDDHKWGVTSRLKIPGGYLYRDTFRGDSVSICFVPDVAAVRS